MFASQSCCNRRREGSREIHQLTESEPRPGGVSGRRETHCRGLAKFADRSAFPNLGQVWFNGGRWGRTSVAAILKRGSIPWPLLSSRALDAAAHERRNTRALGLGGFQPPLDERFDPTWDGE